MSAGGWAAEREAHRAAVREFVAAARAVPAERWEQPLAPGKWTPAQIAEHLRLTYEALRRETTTQRPQLRVRTPFWLRPLLRWRFLGIVLDQRRMPAGARAPREIAPGSGPFPQEATIAAVEHEAQGWEDAFDQRQARGGATLSHHVFGRLRGATAARFVVVHTEHHARQLREPPTA